jgi:bifunctional DNA-binding transcriptional regulator/antitoxin component of YhaV-PrlF toxin-antitoxin module
MGICLPKKIIDYLQVEDGRELQIIRTLNGIELTKLSSETIRALEIAKNIYGDNEELFLMLAND